MRPWMCAFLLGCVACSSGVTGPPRGLPVTLATSIIARVPDSDSLTVAGDSADAIVIQPATCGSTPSADAGMRAGALIITLSVTFTRPFPCAAKYASQRFAMVVHALPTGRYAASVVERTVVGTSATDTVLLRTTVAVP